MAVKAFRVVLLGRYVRGRVMEKYRSKLINNRLRTEAFDIR